MYPINKKGSNKQFIWRYETAFKSKMATNPYYKMHLELASLSIQTFCPRCYHNIWLAAYSGNLG